MIGKHVRITIDGKRPATEGFEEREMGTVTFNNKYVSFREILCRFQRLLTSRGLNRNIALLLVENGWASVVRHRKDDEDRSPIYDELLAAEETYVLFVLGYFLHLKY